MPATTSTSRRLSGGKAAPMKMYANGKKVDKNHMALTTTAGRNRAVAEGRAKFTSRGGLTKKDLVQNKTGQWVSRKKHMNGLSARKNLTAPKYK